MNDGKNVLTQGTDVADFLMEAIAREGKVMEEGVDVKGALKSIDKARNLLMDASLLMPSKTDEMNIHQKKAKEGLENMIKLSEELYKNIKRNFG